MVGSPLASVTVVPLAGTIETTWTMPSAGNAICSRGRRMIIAGKDADDQIRVWVPACAIACSSMSVAKIWILGQIDDPADYFEHLRRTPNER